MARGLHLGAAMKTTRPCIVCGQRPHDAAYHEEWRRRHGRWTNLLESRYPTLRGTPLLSGEKPAEKPKPSKAPSRMAHRVEPTPDFLRSVGRERGARRRLMTLAGTTQWRRLQGHLAYDAPLRPVRGRPPMVEGCG